MALARVPKDATPDQVFAAIATNIDGVAEHSETAARSYIQTCLGVLGYYGAPRTLSGQVDGAVARLYVFDKTPIGDVVLIAGPKWINRFVKMEALVRQPTAGDVYILARADSTANAKAAQTTATRIEKQYGRAQERVAERAAPPPPAPPPPPPVHHAPVARPAPPPPPSPAPTPARTRRSTAAPPSGPPPEVAARLDAAIDGLANLLR